MHECKATHYRMSSMLGTTPLKKTLSPSPAVAEAPPAGVLSAEAHYRTRGLGDQSSSIFASPSPFMM